MAPVSGMVFRAPNKLGGKALRLRSADGTVYYCAHLDGYVAAPKAQGTRRTAMSCWRKTSAARPTTTTAKAHPTAGASAQ